ncbi:S10 family peptidase [Streptomyces sp. NPDC003247]|uniref:S10 family peptidase n=1 Tax=Streptomyces sp. NPDC003247 TaxID=3364677 RepID=UPI0036A6CB3B
MTAYVRDTDDSSPSGDRPVLFAFNGGPGSSSALLHLGGLGPVRASFPTDLSDRSPGPFPLEANPGSVLDVADLVFLDAVNTGYGVAEAGRDAAGVYGVDGDSACFAAVITAWLLEEDRLHAPTFLLGESYGTIRAPMVARRLLSQTTSIAVNGIVLLGQAVNVQETAQRPTNVIGTVAALPYMAATAWYHGRSRAGGADVDEVSWAAHEFAMTEYLPALIRGSLLPDSERRAVAERLAQLTGITPEHLLRSRLRIHTDEFRRRVLQDEGLILGSSDSRYTRPAPDERRGEAVADPASAAIMPGLTAATVRYYRDHLDVPDKAYRMMDAEAYRNWVWHDPASPHPLMGSQPSPFAVFDYAACLSGYLKANPAAHLLIGTGHYDSLTTVGMVEHLVTQNDLPAERLHRKTYGSGHMMYTDPDACAQLNDDLREFIAASRG